MKAILQQLQRKNQFQKELQNEKKKTTIGAKFDNLLKSFDQYGQPFQVSFEGQTQYKTAFGGIISFIVLALIFSYSVYKFKNLIEYKDYTYTSNQEVVVVDDVNYNLTYEDFPLIISVDTELTDDIGYIRVRQGYRKESIDATTGVSTWGTASYDLPLGKCEGYQLNDYVNIGGATYCVPNNVTYIIGGSEDNDKNNNRIFFQVYKCVGKSKSGGDCKSSTEIDDYFATTEFLISFKNSYFAVEDFEEPIQYYYNTNNAYLWLPGTTQNQIVYLQMNTVQLKDGRFLSDTRYETLIQQPREKTLVSQIMSNGALILNVQVQLDYYQTTYVRKAYSFLQFLSDIGGIKTAIFAIGWFFTNFINEKLKYASLIKRIYQFKSKKYGPRKSKTFVELNHRRDDFEELDSKDQEERNPQDTLQVLEDGLQKYNKRDNFENNYSMFTKIKKYFEFVLEVRTRKIDVRDYLLSYRTQLQSFMTERETFKIKTKDIFRLVFCCFFLKSKDSMKRDKNLKKYFYLNKGKEKIEKVFDIVEILRSVRQLKLMRNIFMNEYQRVLFRYQRENLLESDSEESENDDEIFENFEVQNCKDKNQFVKEYVDEIVKNSMQHFEKRVDDLTQLDEKLIGGLVFKSTTNDQFIHRQREEIPHRNNYVSSEKINHASTSYKGERYREKRSHTRNRRFMRFYSHSKQTEEIVDQKHDISQKIDKPTVDFDLQVIKFEPTDHDKSNQLDITNRNN